MISNKFNVVVTECAENEIYLDIDEMAIDMGLPFDMKGAVAELKKQGWKVRREFPNRVIMEL